MTPKKRNVRARGKRGRGVDLTSQESLIPLREVFAKKSHIAPHGAKSEYFESVALALAENSEFTACFDGKSVSDRYGRMQKLFSRSDTSSAKMSGVDREFTEEKELLSMMREGREEEQAQRNEKQLEVERREERKVTAGKEVVQEATSSVAVVIDDDSIHDEDITNLCNSSGTKTLTKKRRSIRSTVQGEGELDRFGEMLRQSDEAQRAVDQRRLAFDERRLEMVGRCRQSDREEQRKEREEDRKHMEREREARERVELEKFGMTLEMLRDLRE